MAAAPRWIAERTLRDERGRRVVARLGAPRPFPDRRNWKCRFEIQAGSRRIAEWAGGVDALQALTLAVEGVRVRLAALGGLTWECASEEGDLGLARMIPRLPKLKVIRRIEAKVEEMAQADYRRSANEMRRRVDRALGKSDGDIRAAAAELGWDVPTLRTVLRSLAKE